MFIKLSKSLDVWEAEIFSSFFFFSFSSFFSEIAFWTLKNTCNWRMHVCCYLAKILCSSIWLFTSNYTQIVPINFNVHFSTQGARSAVSWTLYLLLLMPLPPGSSNILTLHSHTKIWRANPDLQLAFINQQTSCKKTLHWLPVILQLFNYLGTCIAEFLMEMTHVALGNRINGSNGRATDIQHHD